MAQTDADQEYVYDEPTGTAPSNPTPNLKDLENGTEETVEEETEQPEEASEDDDERISLKDLREAEATPTEMAVIYAADRVGHGYVNKPRNLGFIRRQLGKRNRIFLIGGPVVGVIIIAFVIFLSLLPFKILHIVDNLQSRFYASSQVAVGNETDALFSTYLRKYVMPALRKCPASVTRECNPIQSGNLVSQLFQGFRNAKIEDKLAKDGIEFKYTGNTSRRYFIKTPNTPGDGIDLGDENSGFINSDESLGDYINNDPQFRKVNRSELRQAYKDALSKETKWNQVLGRFKISGLLSRKYGLQRCIFACNTRDNFADWKDDKTRAAKIILANKVLAPRSETLAVVMGCIIDGTCEDKTTDADGRQQTAFDSRVQKALDDYAAKYGAETVAQKIATANEIRDKGYAKYAIDKVVGSLIGKFGGDEAAQAATSDVAVKAVPIAGWVQTAAEFDKFGRQVGPLSEKYAFAVNAAGMASTWGVYRVYADEIKDPHAPKDAALVGSMIDSLSEGDSKSAGGTASAEETPLYSQLIDGGSQSSSATVGALFTSDAYAASSSSKVICNDGKPIPAGETVCKEEKLNSGNNVANSISSFFNSPLMAPISAAADFWNSTVGTAFRWLGSTFADIASHIPGVSSLEAFGAQIASPIIHFVTEQLIPSPFSDNQSGGRTFDLLAGGADVTGNEFCHNGLGCQRVKNDNVGEIFNQQQQDQLAQYKSEPFFSRIFDTSSNYSPVTKLAMAMPNSLGAAGGAVASLFSSPLTNVLGSFGSIFSLGHASAATVPANDPFGITQYGYPTNDPALAAANKDPEAYWNSQCSTDGTTLDWTDPNKANAKWQASAAINTDTGQLENNNTDPCLLLQAAVGSAGAIYDESLLTLDDVSSENTGDSSQTTPATSQAGTTIDADTLYDDSSNVACADNTKDLGIQDGYHDGQVVKIRVCAVSNIPSSSEESKDGYGVIGAGGKLVVNSRVSGAVYAMVDAASKAGVTLTASSGFRTMAHQQSLCSGNSLCSGGDYTKVAKPGTSNHQMGLAIDFATLPSDPGPIPGNPAWDWLSKNAATFGYKNYPAEAWHWSPSGN